jgi:4-(gamma-glutamylamino)butanal dehydrogenase
VPEQKDIDALRHAPVPSPGLFIDGKWQSATAGTLDVVSPIDGKKLTTIADADASEVDRAVRAARTAFDAG